MVLFPAQLDNFNEPGRTLAVPKHTTMHQELNAGIEALEAKVGVDDSADTNSLDYKVANRIPLTTINAQTDTNYTLVLTDAYKLVILTNGSPVAVTIPTNAVVAFPIGTQIDFIQGGAGKVTFSGAGTTINSLSSFKSISGQWVGVTLVQTATDVWSLIGSLIS